MADEMKRYILELKKVSRVGDDYYVFDFVKPEGITYKNGQYGAFMHVGKEIEGRKMRAFSFAASIDEDFFRIATKIIETPSDFKDKMRSLSPGETMTVDGPLGSFTLENDRKAVFIAGGIGITPIRSILTEISNGDYNHDVELLYAEDRAIYPFSSEFDRMNKVNVHYIDSREETAKKITNMIGKYMNDAIYYMAGSPGFIKATKAHLEQGGILTKNIKYDQFNGY